MNTPRQRLRENWINFGIPIIGNRSRIIFIAGRRFTSITSVYMAEVIKRLFSLRELQEYKTPAKNGERGSLDH